MKLIRMIDNYINDREFSMIYKNNKLDIINYHEIVDFSSERISIRYNNFIYYVNGTNLVVSKMIEDEILITGNIISINFI